MATDRNDHRFQRFVTRFPGLTDPQRVRCRDVERGRLRADSGSKGGYDRAPPQLQELAVSIFGEEHQGWLTADVRCFTAAVSISGIGKKGSP